MAHDFPLKCNKKVPFQRKMCMCPARLWKTYIVDDGPIRDQDCLLKKSKQRWFGNLLV